MRILVTGSSGWLGRTLVPRLRRDGHQVVGLDPLPSPTTEVVGSIADRDLVHAALRDARTTAVIHAGGLHKPDIARRPAADFVAVNVQGTLNLLQASTAPGATVDRFIFTSTTSVMVDRMLSAGAGGKASWITEATASLQPRNIYGVSKLAAEHLCRMVHEQHGLPVLVLRTARFFPEADDMAHTIVQSDANTKANELLYRRLTVEDAAECHVVALAKAPAIGFDTFIVSAMPPFVPADCCALLVDAPGVVARYFPHYPAIYARLGWTMFGSINRVYDPGKAAQRLGFTCRTGFAEMLEALAARGIP